jgi:hypothetical protein
MTSLSVQLFICGCHGLDHSCSIWLFLYFHRLVTNSMVRFLATIKSEGLYESEQWTDQPMIGVRYRKKEQEYYSINT